MHPQVCRAVHLQCVISLIVKVFPPFSMLSFGGGRITAVETNKQHKQVTLLEHGAWSKELVFANCTKGAWSMGHGTWSTTQVPVHAPAPSKPLSPFYCVLSASRTTVGSPIFPCPLLLFWHRLV
eukprot:1157112-Pelagomonas_calceolata.AAC.4